MKLVVGMEMVAFQSDAFKKMLVTHLKDLRQKSIGEMRDLGFSKPLTDEIRNFTGLQIKVTLDDWGPCIMVPDVNKNNVLVENSMKAFLDNVKGKELVANTDRIFKGSVNIQTGKVTGSFTTVEHTMHLPVGMLADNKYSDEEIAAVMLHEIGHIFVYYEFMTRSVTTNQVLEYVSRNLSKTNDVKTIESVIVDAKKALNLTELDAKKLTKSSDQTKVVEMVILSHAAQMTTSQLGSDIYDINTWEMLADNYATRHGAGRDLVTCLAKLERGSHISYRSQPYFLFLEAIKILLFVGSIGLAAIVPTLTPLAALGAQYAAVAAMSISFILFAVDINSEVYDRPGARLKRIRNQLVERSKDAAVTKQEKDRLKQDIEIIDSILNGVNDRRQFISYLGGIFSKNIRKRYDQEKMQQELETLVSNDLFTVFK